MKILIVEDNPDSREILGLYVTKIGYQVIKAKNSKEASSARKIQTGGVFSLCSCTRVKKIDK
jgi:DNA-binding response OmpR family regulator